MREVDLPMIFYKTCGQKILTFYFVAPCRHLSTIVTPLSACPWIVVFCLTLSPSLSQVSPFTFMLTCFSSIAMGTWWEQEEFYGNSLGTWWKQKDIDGLLMRTRGTWWELFGNKRNLIETWWEQKEFDWNLMRTKGTWLKLDGNKIKLMGYWWEQEEFDDNCLGTWWKQKDFDEILMGTRGIRS